MRVTLKKIAESFGVSISTIKLWESAGKLPELKSIDEEFLNKIIQEFEKITKSDRHPKLYNFWWDGESGCFVSRQ